jgi:hypothetical protein
VFVVVNTLYGNSLVLSFPYAGNPTTPTDDYPKYHALTPYSATVYRYHFLTAFSRLLPILPFAQLAVPK